MAAIPYMPLYIADYMADAGHLTTLEHLRLSRNGPHCDHWPCLCLYDHDTEMSFESIIEPDLEAGSLDYMEALL